MHFNVMFINDTMFPTCCGTRILFSPRYVAFPLQENFASDAEAAISICGSLSFGGFEVWTFKICFNSSNVLWFEFLDYGFTLSLNLLDRPIVSCENFLLSQFRTHARRPPGSFPNSTALMHTCPICRFVQSFLPAKVPALIFIGSITLAVLIHYWTTDIIPKQGNFNTHTHITGYCSTFQVWSEEDLSQSN